MINLFDINFFFENEQLIPYCVCCIINNKTFSLYYKEKSDIIVEFLNKIIQCTNSDIELFNCDLDTIGLIVIDCLTKKNIRFEWFVRDMKFYWIRISFLNIEIRLRCSYKIIPLSIKSIGNLLGLKKKEFPYNFASVANLFYVGTFPPIFYFKNTSLLDYENMIKDKKIFNFKESVIVCSFDNLYLLREALLNIIAIINLYDRKIINFSFSFASLSYKIYKKKFDKFKICEEKIDKNEYEYIKKSYFGGRCEVFGNPNKNEIVHYFDFKGMYSQCMKNKFPTGRGNFKTKNLNIKEPGLHAVKYKSNSVYPVLPYKFNNKLYFPNGELVGIYSHIELDYFIENGGILLDHFSSYSYEKEDFVFENYMDELSEIKNKGTYYQIFGKVMSNGLYGSFALNDNNEETVLVSSEEEFQSYLKNTDVVSWKKINNCTILKITKNNLSKKFLDKKNRWKEEKNRNLLYASFIAAYARIKLHKGFKTILKNNGRLYYSDTDSFFAGFGKNYKNIEMEELKWSDVFEDAVFISPKFYYIKKNKNNIDEISNNFEEIKTEFYNNKNSLIYENQLRFSKKNYSIIDKFLKKKLTISAYDKRIFDDDKKNSSPVFL